jgi:hypothetical protein
MRRPKRVSRRELKAKIRELNLKAISREGQLLASKAEISQLHDRLNRLGTQIESLDSGDPIQMIEIKPIPFGQYAMLTDEFMFKEIPDEIKNQIVNYMASQLLENAYVQFMIGTNNFTGEVTLGAKIYVVPWEQMARRRTTFTAIVKRGKQDGIH